MDLKSILSLSPYVQHACFSAIFRVDFIRDANNAKCLSMLLKEATYWNMEKFQKVMLFNAELPSTHNKKSD